MSFFSELCVAVVRWEWERWCWRRRSCKGDVVRWQGR